MADRVLHVIDASESGDGAMLACAEALRRAGGSERALLLGGRAAAARAAALGLACERVAPPVGRSVLAWRSIRCAAARGGADRVRAWGDRAARACRLAGLGGGGWAGRVEASQTIGDAPPEGMSREAARAALGVGGDSTVVALLGDPARLCDARRFVYLVGVLDVSETPVTGVIDSGASHLGRARRYHGESGVRWPMLIAATPVSLLLRGADLAAVMTPEPLPALSASDRASMRAAVRRAHALGVPVVAAGEWLGERECPEGLRGSLAAGGGELVEIAKRLTALMADAGERRRVAGLLRAHVAGGEV